jgi:hypothetical protein
MSLRVFHVIFIAVSVILSLFVAVWSVREYQATGSTAALLLGFVFLIAGGAMVEYGRRWFHKLKELS